MRSAYRRTKKIALCLLLVTALCFIGIGNVFAHYEQQSEFTDKVFVDKLTAAESQIGLTSKLTTVDGDKCLQGQVIVQFEMSQSKDEMQTTLNELNSSPTNKKLIDNMVLVKVPDGNTIEDFIEELEDNPNVKNAQPNYFYELEKSIDDPSSQMPDPTQWHLDRVNAYEAWDITMGSWDVKVAVLDTGIDSNHPDLSDRVTGLWTVVEGDNDYLDDDGHGTHVAGIIAATANNGIGGAGVAPNSQLIGIDVFGWYQDNLGEWKHGASTADVVNALYLAESEGADVANLSLGSYYYDYAMKTAIDFVTASGMVVVAAAGNDGVTHSHYPSDYANAIGVIWLNKSNIRDVYSNYGSAKEISAPGSSIYSTYLGSGYSSMSGTSMASPVVAGVVALMLSINPNMDINEVRSVIADTATDLGSPGFDNYYGYGLINAEEAVERVAQTVRYRTHVQNIGWQDWKYNGEQSGTSGQSLRLEGIYIETPGWSNGVEYRTHVQNIGWQDWRTEGKMAGTSGQSLRLEAIEIRLKGEAAERYDIYYRVHAQNFGWMDWAKNGQSAGSAGYSYRLEAIEIKLVEKGGAAPGPTSVPFRDANGSSADISVKYQTHVQNVGWQGWKKDGEVSGTSGQSLRLEGMYIQIDGADDCIEYRTHVQNIGWQDWVGEGQMTGTSGKSLRLEAIDIRLKGDMASKYDIYYRVHAQNVGWMDWAKNGQSAGTAGFSYRLEAIQIVLVDKGGSAPGSTAKPFISA